MKITDCTLVATAVAVLALLVGGWTSTAAAQEVDPRVLEAERQRIEVVAKASKATCAIFAGGAGGGSGVLITPDGYALSNFHVTQPAGNAMKVGLDDGKLYDAVIVGVDPVGDVALIKLFGRDDFPFAEMADSDAVRVGDWCFAIGNPFLLATDFTPSVSYGIVSGVNRYQYPAGTLLEYADCIQTDAAINPGNSGGPLFNAQGELIGVNGRGSFEKRGRVNVGVGYAISINQIKNFMGYLRSGRVVEHATLGATVSSDTEGRVFVNNILSSSDAYRRGLRYGDEVIRFGGRRIRTVNAFKNVLGIFPRGWRVPLVYRRDGKDYETIVRLTGVHPEGELWARAQGNPAQPRGIPIPKPGEEDNEGDKKEEGEKPKPIPIQIPGLGKPKMPAAMKPYFQEKRGFANYHFNELNQKRIFHAWQRHGEFAAAPWKFAAGFVGGGRIDVEVTDAAGTAVTEDYNSKADFSGILSEQLAPTGRGGMLPALHCWRRLAIGGLQNYGEIYYLGEVPLLGDRDQLVDVLVGIHEGIETRFLFSPTDGLLVGIEMFPDSGVDPCELYFSDYHEVDGRMLPQKISVRHGNDIFARFENVQWEVGPAPAKDAETPADDDQPAAAVDKPDEAPAPADEADANDEDTTE